jgi:hypothetical protein
MADETSRFRRGAIHLGYEDEEAPVESEVPARAATPWLTITLYWLVICASIVGLCSLIWSLSIINSYDWGDKARPFFYQVFKEKFSPVTGLVRDFLAFSQYRG